MTMVGERKTCCVQTAWSRNKTRVHFTEEDVSDIILKVGCNDGDMMQK